MRQAIRRDSGSLHGPSIKAEICLDLQHALTTMDPILPIISMLGFVAIIRGQLRGYCAIMLLALWRMLRPSFGHFGGYWAIILGTLEDIGPLFWALWRFRAAAQQLYARHEPCFIIGMTCRALQLRYMAWLVLRT